MKQNYLLEGIDVLAVGEASLDKVLARVIGCAACCRSASTSFESLLHHTFGTSGMTEYFLSTPMHCPKCDTPIFERTLVDFSGKAKAALEEIQYFDSRDEEQDVVFVDESTLLDAESFISACEHCSARAEIPFDQILDAITGCDPRTTEYVICHAAKCGNCHSEVMEKTLVLPL
jgi:hypothetical protein